MWGGVYAAILQGWGMDVPPALPAEVVAELDGGTAIGAVWVGHIIPPKFIAITRWESGLMMVCILSPDVRQESIAAPPFIS
jgi:hypothetical protein